MIAVSWKFLPADRHSERESESHGTRCPPDILYRERDTKWTNDTRVTTCVVVVVVVVIVCEYESLPIFSLASFRHRCPPPRPPTPVSRHHGSCAHHAHICLSKRSPTGPAGPLYLSQRPLRRQSRTRHAEPLTAGCLAG